jgi:hypothetical protein
VTDIHRNSPGTKEESVSTTVPSTATPPIYDGSGRLTGGCRHPVRLRAVVRRGDEVVYSTVN